jgi:hypothetical protein
MPCCTTAPTFWLPNAMAVIGADERDLHAARGKDSIHEANALGGTLVRSDALREIIERRVGFCGGQVRDATCCYCAKSYASYA